MPLQLWAWLGVSSNDVLTTQREDGSTSVSLIVHPPKERVVLHVGVPDKGTLPSTLAHAVPFRLTATFQ